MKKILSKKGFTLIELVLSMAIMTIIIGFVLSVIKPVSLMLNELNSDTTVITIANTNEYYIRRALEYSYSANIMIDTKFDNDVKDEVVKLIKQYNGAKDNPSALVFNKLDNGGYELYDVHFNDYPGAIIWENLSAADIKNKCVNEGTRVFKKDFFAGYIMKYDLQRGENKTRYFCRLGIEMYRDGVTEKDIVYSSDDTFEMINCRFSVTNVDPPVTDGTGSTIVFYNTHKR